jgi:hypothetical protein
VWKSAKGALSHTDPQAFLLSTKTITRNDGLATPYTILISNHALRLGHWSRAKVVHFWRVPTHRRKPHTCEFFASLQQALLDVSVRCCRMRRPDPLVVEVAPAGRGAWLVAALGPLMTGWLISALGGLEAAAAVMSLIYVLGLIVTPFAAPETRGNPLPA